MIFVLNGCIYIIKWYYINIENKKGDFKMLNLLKKLDKEFEKKFGEELIHNPEEAKKMADFIIDVYKEILK